MAIVAPWFGGALGGSTRTVPRVTPRPTQGIDPITGVPIPLDDPVPITSESQLEKDVRNGMTLDKPGAIPVEQVGYGGGNNDQKKIVNAQHLICVMANQVSNLEMIMVFNINFILRICILPH